MSPPSSRSRANSTCRSWAAAPAPDSRGGAIPREGGVMVAFARMNRILEIDLENERAVVAAGRGQSRYHPGRRAQRLLLRARPLQPARLHHRRQRGRKRRRPAHPGLRRHHQPRAGPGTGAARWHGGRDRRQGAGPAGLRPDRPADRLGRHHGAGHQGHRAADAQARRRSRPSWPSTNPTRTPAARWPRSPRAPSRRWPSRCWTA